MKKDKVLLATVLAISLCLAPMSASAASKKEIKKVQTTVKKFYNAAKVYNAPRMKSCFVNPDKLQVFIENKEMARFCRKQNKKLRYSIRTTKVKGKNATVIVRCTYRDAYDPLYYSIQDTNRYLFDNFSATEEKLRDMMGFYLSLNWITYYKPLSSRNITFNLKNFNGKWLISKVSKSIINSVNCNYEKAYRDYFAQYD